MANSGTYWSLSMDDFKNIAERTKYTPNYVRKVVKGYVHATERNQVILNLAKETHKEKTGEDIEE